MLIPFSTPTLPMPPAAGSEIPIAEEPQEAVGPQFKTHLKLSKPREEWLVDRIVVRITELLQEMGMEEDGTVDITSWMGRRCRYQDTYDNDLEWRKALLGGVFTDSNLTLGTTKRYVREMSAKVNDDFFGTSPFFGTMKKKEGAGLLAKAVEEYLQGKVESSNLQQTMREAVRTALIRNEAVVKLRNESRPSPFVGPATVLVVNGTDVPVTTPNGYLIYENDDFLPDPNVENQVRLKKDPLFFAEIQETVDEETGESAGPKMVGYEYLKFESLPQNAYECDGLEAAVLDARSFLCPLRESSIHKADINVHLYDETVERLQETYGGFEVFDAYVNGYESSGERQPKTAHGEINEENISSKIKRRRIAEVYIRCDADEDGREEEIMLVLDRDSQTPVFYEYLKNQMDSRPFEVIVGVESVPNRWYGVGIMQMLEDPNNYIDAQFNRINLKDSKNASIDFRIPAACKQWKAGHPTEFGTDQVFDLEQGFDQQTNPPIFRINLQDETSKQGWDLIGKAEQAGNLQFGVISAKDASVTNMNQSRTATGILNLERTANVLTAATEQDQLRGVERVLEQAVEIVIENMKEAELFFSKDGAILHTLSREEVRELDREVKLLLTRSRSTEMLATSQQVLTIAKDYFALKAQDPRAAQSLRPSYVRQLKALEEPDADELLPEVTAADIEEWKKAMSAPPPSPPRDFIQYSDTPPSVQKQMEAESGFVPASDEERAAWIESQKKPAKPASGSSPAK